LQTIGLRLLHLLQRRCALWLARDRLALPGARPSSRERLLKTAGFRLD
tara:strand:- start:2555 stop:2698 length:144 start_codon:yes stop_codon:yes gene_type:complete